jgi:hypothetical protein
VHGVWCFVEKRGRTAFPRFSTRTSKAKYERRLRAAARRRFEKATKKRVACRHRANLNPLPELERRPWEAGSDVVLSGRNGHFQCPLRSLPEILDVPMLALPGYVVWLVAVVLVAGAVAGWLSRRIRQDHQFKLS